MTGDHLSCFRSVAFDIPQMSYTTVVRFCIFFLYPSRITFPPPGGTSEARSALLDREGIRQGLRPEIAPSLTEILSELASQLASSEMAFEA